MRGDLLLVVLFDVEFQQLAALGAVDGALKQLLLADLLHLAAGSGGKRFRILGYEIEAWDGTAWGAPEFREGASYTYVTGTDPAKVRLTWKWQGPGTTLLFR